MDAALWELLEEGDSEDEVAAIIRLGQPGVAPPGVRLVAKFGHIATCRLKRSSIVPTRADEAVASFKAARVLAPEQEIDEQLLEKLTGSFPFLDERRPDNETATGRGVVVGVVDWGCDFAHPDFRNADGSTRLLALWDQRSREDSTPPAPYGYGVVHTTEAINRALTAADPYLALNYDPDDADTGSGSHGTHVLGIAAGNGRAGGPQGVAPEAQLIFVHSATLSPAGSDKLGNSVTLLEAVDFIAQLAGNRPWVINLSMGRHGEPHDGSTLVEQGLDEVLRAAPGRAIVQSTGNYFERRIHSSGQLRPTEEKTLSWEVEEVDPTPNQLEIWYSGPDRIDLEISGPGQILRETSELGDQVPLTFEGRNIGKIYHRRSEPNNLCNHIEIYLYRGAPAGAWQIRLKGRDIVDGRYHAWIERDAACSKCQSRFGPLDSVTASTTGTICNGFRTIAVGAYNSHSPRHELAPFSSSGPTRDGRMKPDLVAPGIRILAARSRPREPKSESMLTRMSGTSMASPYVAGTVALMFEVAGRPLRVEETHNLLLGGTRKANLIGETLWRLGSGYCEISTAVTAARSVSGQAGLAGTQKLSDSEAIMEIERHENGPEAIENDQTERTPAKRNFILISGGPGPYDNRDIEHDQSWANYVTPPLLMTDSKAKVKAFAEKDEKIWWFVYKSAYEKRWSEDSKSKTEARKKEVKRVKDLKFSSYVDLIKERAKDRGWELRWLAEADDVWDKLKTLSKGSISRVWYWGHARDDLWLTVQHDASTHRAISPDADEIITIASIDPGLKDYFQSGDLKRIHRFVGCNTANFAEAWAKAYGVWTEGVEDKVNFISIHQTGGEPCLSDSARVKYFATDGSYDSAQDSRTTATKCKDLPHEALEYETTVEQDDSNLEYRPAYDFGVSGTDDFQDFNLAAPFDSQWAAGAAPEGTSGQEDAQSFAFTEYDEDHNHFTSEDPVLPGTTLLAQASEVIGSGRWPRLSHRAMLSEALERVMGSNALTTKQPGSSVSPAAIFEAFAYGKNPAVRQEMEQVFEVVALPRSPITGIRQGDLLFRHPVGEGAFTHAAILTTGETFKQEYLAAFGLKAESARPGYYAEVIEAGLFPHRQGDRFARRLSDESGLLSHDSLILRIRSDSYHPLRPALSSVEEAGGTAGSLPTRLNGIDIYEANTGFPSLAKIAKAGYSFVFHKASQFWPDNKLASRWPQIAQAGMLRGAYHLLSHNAGSVAEQVERFGTTVGRLVPGDLGPSLDLEDRDAGHHSDFWIPRINQFADLIEARLGRQPIFYTSRSYWQEFANDDLGFGQYPLWVVWVNPGEPRLPAGWTKWHFWQWHWEKSTTPMPAPFAASDKGVDLDRFNGTIYQLRGMADLGHTAPHVAASQDSVAYSEVDGRIHLLESVKGSWIDHDLFNRVQWTNVIGTLPPAAGDPAAMTLGNEQVIVYRSGDGGVHALTRTIGTSDTSWHAVDITGGEGKAVGDPFIFLFENNVHVIYWDQFNTQVHVMRVKGVWQAEHFVDSVSPHTPSQISGSATAYKFQNALHIVSRSRKDGHLFDFIAPAGRAAPQDLTAASQDAGGRNPPAATYQPATYTPEGKAPRIVFRAVRGNVWQIERDTLSALDVSLDAGHAPPAAGNPTAVVADRPHIFYRTMDGTIIDIFDDAGVWRRRNVCADAAADPTAFVDSQGHAAVSFRAIDGTIRIARFVNSAWNCENAARPQGAGSGESAPNGSEGAGIQRSSSLPFLLAGPIVRRATPERVWLWFACSKEPKGCQPSITAYDDKGKVWTHLVDPHFKEIVLRVEEDRVARLGENIWIVLCSAVPSSGKFPTDIILGYELSIATEENGNVKWTKLADLNLNITYAPFPRPTFVIGELNRRIAHGSCRRPGASGEDASDVFDEWMAKTAPDAFKRPASMILTGDQIYADDVAVPLFKAVRRIAFDVFGYVEKIPNPNGTALTPADNYSWTNNGQLPEFPWGLNKAAAIPAVQEMIRKVWSGRKQLTHRLTSLIGFTTDDGEAHLLSFPEYAAMYLAVWNPEICKGYGVDDGSDENLRGFERAVKAFRRVMANTATYMVSDDHDITDDWNLDQQWEETTKKNPMARRIIANGLAAFWGFQAWGNEPDDFDAGFVNIVKEHVEELRAGNGRPGNAAKQCEQTLLDRHWSFMAASNPKALCVDTRTRRETPKGKTAVLSGKRVWPFMANLLRKHGFRRGDVLLLVLPTPFLPHRSMMYIQKEEFKWPKDRYEGDFELYGNNPQQRAELVLWLEYNFAPSSLVILSGDVHHGSVITGRYGYGSSLQKIKTGQADWAMRIVQITSSPIKNVKSEAYEKKRWWTLWQTDAGNAGESLIPQWETQYATTDKNNYIAMQAFTRKLEGELGRRTYVFENHFCVVDMPSRPGALVNVLFTGVKNGRLATASIPVDTDNDPSKFQIDYVLGRELPRGVLMPGYEMEEQVIQYPPAAISIRPSLSPSNAPGLFVSPANNVAAAAGGDWRYQNPIHHAGSSVLYRARGSNPGFSEMEISSGEQFSFEQQPASGVGASGTCPPGIMPVTGSPTTASLLWTTPNPRGVCRVGTILYVVNRETGAINQFDFVTGRAGPQIWAGPGPEFGPFVGPTWVPDTSELVVAALGRDNWDPRNPRPRNPLLGTRPGTLFAVNLHSGQRTVCDQSRSAFHREALNGCAGTTMLPNGDLAVSGFWSGRVSAVDVRHGDIRPVFTNLASMASATRSNPTDTNRSPDGVRAHSSGEFLICDRTQGQLLAGRIGGTPRVLVCGIQDPIAVDIDTAGNALVLSKTNTVVYEVVLSTGAGALIARSCRPIAMAVPSGRGCLALSVDGRHRVIIVVDSDSDNSADGLYQT